MLRKEINEIELLKAQIQELAKEVEALKLEMNSRNKNDFSAYDSGKGFGKILGRAMIKQESPSEALGNKQMFNQFVRTVVNAVGTRGPSSFGRE